MTRNQVLVALGGGLLLLGAAELLGGGCGCTIHGPLSWTSTPSKDGVELPYARKLHLGSPAKVGRLVLDLEAASIVVEGDPSVTGVEADYEVREKTQGDASLAAGPDGVDVRSASGSPVLVTSAKVRVPPGTEVDAATALGSVTVSGIRGAASVAARTDAGSVSLHDLADVPKVTAHTDLGDVALVNGATVGEVSLTTDAGSASARDVAGATTVTLHSDLGGVTAASVAASGSVSLETNSGSVKVSDVRTARARFHSDLGDVKLERSTFDHVVARTNLGSVRLKACKYKTKDLGTDLGSVKEED